MGHTIIEHGPIGYMGGKPIYRQSLRIPDGEDYIPIWLLDKTPTSSDLIPISVYARFDQPLRTEPGHEVLWDNSTKTVMTGPDFPGPYNLGNQIRAR